MPVVRKGEEKLELAEPDAKERCPACGVAFLRDAAGLLGQMEGQKVVPSREFTPGPPPRVHRACPRCRYAWSERMAEQT